MSKQKAVRIAAPFSKGALLNLKAGEEVLLSGTIYTARDQAHKRLVELIENNKKFSVDLRGQIIYYCGATATPQGRAIGSCGPTTSIRMDNFVEPLLRKGLLGMIGKGRRSRKVRDLIKKYKAVYFIAPGGCGALLAEKVLLKEIVSFKDLGPEAVCRLEVKDFPLIVGIDCRGRSIYEDA